MHLTFDLSVAEFERVGLFIEAVSRESELDVRDLQMEIASPGVDPISILSFPKSFLEMRVCVVENGLLYTIKSPRVTDSETTYVRVGPGRRVSVQRLPPNDAALVARVRSRLESVVRWLGNESSVTVAMTPGRRDASPWKEIDSDNVASVGMSSLAGDVAPELFEYSALQRREVHMWSPWVPMRLHEGARVYLRHPSAAASGTMCVEDKLQEVPGVAAAAQAALIASKGKTRCTFSVACGKSHIVFVVSPVSQGVAGSIESNNLKEPEPELESDEEDVGGSKDVGGGATQLKPVALCDVMSILFVRGVKNPSGTGAKLVPHELCLRGLALSLQCEANKLSATEEAVQTLARRALTGLGRLPRHSVPDNVDFSRVLIPPAKEGATHSVAILEDVTNGEPVEEESHDYAMAAYAMMCAVMWRACANNSKLQMSAVTLMRPVHGASAPEFEQVATITPCGGVVSTDSSSGVVLLGQDPSTLPSDVGETLGTQLGCAGAVPFVACAPNVFA